MTQNVAEPEVFTHRIDRVCSAQVVGSYTLHITFDDHTEQTINFQSVLVGELYGPLRDLALFAQVQVDPEVHPLVWPNVADFDPATLHDWPQQTAELAERVREWQTINVSGRFGIVR
jgi:hypothetical protein